MRSFFFCTLLLVAAGCSEAPKANREPAKQTDTIEVASVGSQEELLKPTMMARKPATVISVTEALQRKAGETVIVSGKLPPENVKPFNAALATFIMLSPEALAREEIKDELACEDAATCPSCRKVLDAHGVRVELVDQSGAIIPTTLEGFKDLKPGSIITVEGEIKRDGKENKLVRIVAKRFFPG
ncbi:MAG TPA: hypothetical protein PLN21_17510 [Gemmatales bacterium]|nr:hypothetical protein [Gemmatales bacterium]